MSTFFKLHHGFIQHPKHIGLSRDALLLHICGCLYASERLTDGHVPKEPRVLMQWAVHFVADGVDVGTVAGELVDAGVWADGGDHWIIAKFLDHNRSKSEVEEIRAADRARKRAERAKKSELPDTYTETGTPPGIRLESETCPVGHDDDLIVDFESIRRQAGVT